MDILEVLAQKQSNKSKYYIYRSGKPRVMCDGGWSVSDAVWQIALQKHGLVCHDYEHVKLENRSDFLRSLDA